MEQDRELVNKFMKLTFNKEGYFLQRKPFLRNHLRQGNQTSNLDFCINGANLMTGKSNPIALKLQALEILDYALSFKDTQLTNEITGSKFWVIIVDLIKWAARSSNKDRITNIFNARTDEDKKITIEFRDKLVEYVRIWGEKYPNNEHGRQSVFKDALVNMEENMLRESEVSNPLEVKKITFDPITVDVSDNLPASSYFAIVLSIFDEIKSQLKKAISRENIYREKIIELLAKLDLVNSCTQNQMKMEELFTSGEDQSNNLVGNIITANTEIEVLKREYQEALHSVRSLTEIREKYGVVVFAEDEPEDDLPKGDSFIIVEEFIEKPKKEEHEQHLKNLEEIRKALDSISGMEEQAGERSYGFNEDIGDESNIDDALLDERKDMNLDEIKSIRSNSGIGDLDAKSERSHRAMLNEIDRQVGENPFTLNDLKGDFRKIKQGSGGRGSGYLRAGQRNPGSEEMDLKEKFDKYANPKNYSSGKKNRQSGSKGAGRKNNVVIKGFNSVAERDQSHQSGISSRIGGPGFMNIQNRNYDYSDHKKMSLTENLAENVNTFDFNKSKIKPGINSARNAEVKKQSPSFVKAPLKESNVLERAQNNLRMSEFAEESRTHDGTHPKPKFLYKDIDDNSMVKTSPIPMSKSGVDYRHPEGKKSSRNHKNIMIGDWANQRGGEAAEKEERTRKLLVAEKNALLEKLERIKRVDQTSFSRSDVADISHSEMLSRKFDISKGIILNEYEKNRKLREDLILKRQKLIETAKDREALFRTVQEKSKKLNSLKRQAEALRKAVDSQTEKFRRQMKLRTSAKTGSIDRMNEAIIKRIQEPEKYDYKGNLKQTESDEPTQDYGLKVLSLDLKRDFSGFPPFFEKPKKKQSDLVLSDLNSFREMALQGKDPDEELRSRWKFAAIKKSAILHEDPENLKIGITQVLNDDLLLPNSNQVRVKLIFYNKSQFKLRVSLDWSGVADFSVVCKSPEKPVVILVISQKMEIELELRLKSIPYTFPKIRAEVTIVPRLNNLSQTEKYLETLELFIPMTVNWFKRPIKFKADYIERSVSQADGIYLQSDYYSLDEKLFKGKNEILFLIPEFKQLKAQNIGFVERAHETILGHGIHFQQGYGFVMISLNRDGMFNVSVITPKQNKEEASILVNHYLVLLSK